MATQNPIEQEGTYPLPEAQVDRFLLKVVIGYPSKEEEKVIIRQNITNEKKEIRPLLKPEEILEAQRVVEKIYIDEKIERYIVDIVFATRFRPNTTSTTSLQSSPSVHHPVRQSALHAPHAATHSSADAATLCQRMSEQWPMMCSVTVSDLPTRPKPTPSPPMK